MRVSRRGMTLTELLVVVAIIGVLAAMLSPVLLNGYREAIRQRCAANLSENQQALELLRAEHFGKLPRCFELVPGTTTVDERSWWPCKIARKLYPTSDPVYEQLTVPRSDDPFWATAAGRDLRKFPPDAYIGRCPASPDDPDDRHAPVTVPTCYEIDKDRYYDDNYGYNNFGFAYSPNVRTIALPNGPNAIPTSYLYHRPNAAGQGGRTPMEPVRGSFVDTPSSTNIGEVAEIADPAATILIMDYIKADAQPFPGVDELYGYRFRHRGKANVLFVDGHVEGYTKARFLREVGGPTLHWEIRR